MTNKFYDFLRYATAVIPILATLYLALADIWGLPYAEAIVGTCTAVTAFLAALTKIVSGKYFADKEIVSKGDTAE